MSDTITDMPKVTQMLDAGWDVRICKNPLGSYTAMASHAHTSRVSKANRRLLAAAPAATREIVRSGLSKRQIETDDFTPEQALTRLAYKVHGEII